MKKREMRVYRARGTSREINPMIVMQGKWLRDMGFSSGDRISVTCEDGRLIVEKADRLVSDLKGEGMEVEETAGHHRRAV